MSEQQSIYKPFDSAFKTLVAVCPQLLIPVVNELFGTTFTYDDEVVLMDSKQMKPMPKGKIATREVDSLFAINGARTMLFHVECQSSPDNTMVARFWEYDSLIAMRSAKISPDGVMDIEFPRSAVLYLRHKKSTPDALTIRLKRETGEPIVICEIPIVKTQAYALDDLIRKGLIFLFPFYAFKHEDELCEYDADEGRAAVLREELDRMMQKLSEESAAGRIDGMMRRAIQGAMMSVLRGLGGEYDNLMKGVEEMLDGAILDLDVIRIHDKAWEEGEAAGKLRMLFDLVGKGRLTELEASEEIKMSVADFKRRMSEYDRSRA